MDNGDEIRAEIQEDELIDDDDVGEPQESGVIAVLQFDGIDTVSALETDTPSILELSSVIDIKKGNVHFNRDEKGNNELNIEHDVPELDLESKTDGGDKVQPTTAEPDEEEIPNNNDIVGGEEDKLESAIERPTTADKTG